MVFKKKFTNEQFAVVMDIDIAMTAGAISDKSKLCDESTVLRYMLGMESKGIVKRVPVVLTGNNMITGWLLLQKDK